MKREKTKFFKPIYVGLCSLNSSEILMCDAFYNYILKKFGQGQRPLFTETDKLVYEKN